MRSSKKKTLICKSYFKSYYMEEFPWARPVLNDRYSVKCLVCHNKIFSLSNMGKGSLRSHENTATHNKNLKVLKTSSRITNMFSTVKSAISTTESNLNATQIDSNANIRDTGGDHSHIQIQQTKVVAVEKVQITSKSNSSSSISSFVNNEKVQKAQILYILNGVVRHLSLRDMELTLPVIRAMDPESEIFKKIQLSKSSISYMINYGIAVNFLTKLLDSIDACDALVLGFDETLNKVLQKQQMDISIKFWDYKTQKTTVRYVTSAFLGRVRAVDIMDALTKNIPVKMLKKIIQVSMDGPNVNLVVHKNIETMISKKTNGKQLIDIGPCGLHIIHNAFKASFKNGKDKYKNAELKLDWDLAVTLRALFNLTHDSSARKSIYESASNSDIVAKCFNGIRWTENSPVAEQARRVLPNMVKYVVHVVKEKAEPSCNSYKIVKKALNDEMLDAKLAFFQTLASDLEPFLTEFQSDEPKAPLLFNALNRLVSNVMKRVAKPEEIAKSSKSLWKIDLNDDTKLLTAEKVKLGYATMDALKKAEKVSGINKLNFRNDCRLILIAFLKKYLEKCSLKYQLIKGISCFDPSVALDKEIAEQRLSLALQKFVAMKLISSIQAEKVEREFSELLSSPCVKQKLENCVSTKSRLDTCWMTMIKELGETHFENLAHFARLVFILSHGNAALERGFSVNKECLADNQGEKALISRRLICDTVKAAGVEVQNFFIDKSLLEDIKLSSKRYRDELAKIKKTREEAEKEAERVEENALELRKIEIEQQKAADEYFRKSAELENKKRALKKK